MSTLAVSLKFHCANTSVCWIYPAQITIPQEKQISHNPNLALKLDDVMVNIIFRFSFRCIILAPSMAQYLLSAEWRDPLSLQEEVICSHFLIAHCNLGTGHTCVIWRILSLQDDNILNNEGGKWGRVTLILILIQPYQRVNWVKLVFWVDCIRMNEEFC